MPFFARPNLDDTQFKQLPDSQLSLSGQTRIVTVTGLTLANDSIGTSYPDIVITAESADVHVGDVLTYDGAGKIKLLPSGAGGDPIYPITCKSPASVSLCGISAGFILTGKTLSNILETLLVPTLQPTATQPSFSFDLSPSTTLLEVGYRFPTLSSVNGNFSKGTISQLYCGTPNCRSGAALSYNYNVFGISVSNPAPNITLGTNVPTGGILAGNNTITGYAAYAAGPTILDSVGNTATGPTVTPNPLPAGNTGVVTKTLTGVYPWFWGKSASLPVAGQTLLNSYTSGGGKCVASSVGAITVTNHNASDEYIWFAIPNASPSRTAWQGSNNPSNNGVIPGALFPTVTALNVNSPDGLWNGSSICYKFYISGYKTSVNYGMTYS